jgi:hypothetical protein
VRAPKAGQDEEAGEALPALPDDDFEPLEGEGTVDVPWRTRRKLWYQKLGWVPGSGQAGCRGHCLGCHVQGSCDAVGWLCAVGHAASRSTLTLLRLPPRPHPATAQEGLAQGVLLLLHVLLQLLRLQQHGRAVGPVLPPSAAWAVLPLHAAGVPDRAGPGWVAVLPPCVCML